MVSRKSVGSSIRRAVKYMNACRDLEPLAYPRAPSKGLSMGTRIVLACAAGLALILGSDAAYAAPQQKLESFLSYSFLNGLSTPEAGNRIGWIELRQGVRTIWIAEGPDFQPRRVASSGLDDGQELTGLTFSPDGRIAAWVRGGGEHLAWAEGLPSPNPASAVDQPKTEIWVLNPDGAPVRVAEGEAPTLSIKGRLAYLKDNQVWTIDLDGKGKPTKLFYDRGKVDSLSWSPDGDKLAFVSRRGDHSFIGVYTGPDHPLKWLAPATAFDDNPTWSLDGLRIAFSRRAGVADAIASPLTDTPNPFSIWVGSITDGSAKAVWRSPKTLNGSFPTVPDGLFLMWGSGDRLTFRAEMDGWPHLYSVPSTGGDATLLTPGAFMVEDVAMTPDRRSLLYSANAGDKPGDLDRRHVFRVNIDRPGTRSLTPDSGLEWTPVPVGNDRLAFVSSTATTPMRIMLAKADGREGRSIDISGAEKTIEGLVVPKPVIFTATDGTTVHGQLFLPADGKPRQPGLIFVHGGPPRQMLLGWSPMDYYTHAYAMNQYLASQGFVVLSVNYRLGIGYGRAFQHAAKAGSAGASEYLDVVAGARFLQALPGVDPNRIGIWGGSYGGYLTALALARDSDIFKVGVDLHGVHDRSLIPHSPRPPRYEQGSFDEVMKSAFDSSPEAALAGWRSPVLLIQGDDDRNVPFNQTVDLARRLAAQGTPFEELILPNEIHGFLRYESWLKADIASSRFLKDALRP